MFACPVRCQWPQYVSVDHEPDLLYKFYFGELQLCAICCHKGELHELMVVRYVWPDLPYPVKNPKESDAIPLSTKYIYYPATGKYAGDQYEVKDVQGAQYRPHLTPPPRFSGFIDHSSSNFFLILNNDIYERGL